MLSKSDPIKLKEIIFIIIFLFVSRTSAMAANENIVIIANTSVPVDSMSHDDIKNIFLGMEKIWKNKIAINIVVQDNSSNIHKAFISKLIHKTPAQFYRYWRREVFLGHCSLPASFNDEKSLIEYVAKTPGAIGYVSTAPQSSQIKTIRIAD